jgi:hypothetical protein
VVAPYELLEDSLQPQHAGIDVRHRGQLVLRLPKLKWRALRLQTCAGDQGRPDHHDALRHHWQCKLRPNGRHRDRARAAVSSTEGRYLTAEELYWSLPYVELREGEFTLTVSLSPDQWTSVFGQKGAEVPNEFNAAIPNLGNVGFTFGGTFAGHGVLVTGGNARFVLKEFRTDGRACHLGRPKWAR